MGRICPGVFGAWVGFLTMSMYEKGNAWTMSSNKLCLCLPMLCISQIGGKVKTFILILKNLKECYFKFLVFYFKVYFCTGVWLNIGLPWFHCTLGTYTCCTLSMGCHLGQILPAATLTLHSHTEWELQMHVQGKNSSYHGEPFHSLPLQT